MKTWSMYHDARQLLLVVSAVNNLVLHSYKISQVFTKIVTFHDTYLALTKWSFKKTMKGYT
jgi:hypothetical protein